jgi:hypothetical protein
VTTVFPRQGHYAHDPEVLDTNPAADLTVERIGDLVDYDLAKLIAAGIPRPPAPPRVGGVDPGSLRRPDVGRSG